MMSHPTAPEQHWKGPEGDAYAARQTLTIESRMAMFHKILSSRRVDSIIEFGASTGDNLRALRMLLIHVQLAGVEPNWEAYKILKTVANEALNNTIQDLAPIGTYDLTFTRGVLIHIPPEELPVAYRKLYEFSKRYVLIAEYYNPKPVMIPYRGQDNLLWKRDFAGEMLDAYPDLKLVDYGFVYHRDPSYPQDDVTWFLMEKT